MSEQASEKGLVNVGALFMTDAQPPKTMKPTKSPLNDPTPSTEPFASLYAVACDLC